MDTISRHSRKTVLIKTQGTNGKNPYHLMIILNSRNLPTEILPENRKENGGGSGKGESGR